MHISKYISTAIIACSLASCSDNAPDSDNATMQPDDFVIKVDMPSSVKSRLSFQHAIGEGLNSSGAIETTWEKGDIIKVYETTSNATSGYYTDCYDGYKGVGDSYYGHRYPYPAAPTVDVYYRFECVGGEGSSQGIFKYVGLATTTVTDDVNGRYVDVDIKYDYPIHNWRTFQGMAIFGNPLRNHMMRTQKAPNDLSHLKYGERMYGSVSAYNFDWYAEKNSNEAGIDRIVLKNVESCIYRILVGGMEVPVYGGSKLTLTIPGVTDGSGLRGHPMELTLGNPDDFVLGNDPWCQADPEKTQLNDPQHAFVAYIVGWPGKLLTDNVAVVTLHEYASDQTFTWSLKATEDRTFVECEYYTIDLRDKKPTNPD